MADSADQLASFSPAELGQMLVVEFKRYGSEKQKILDIIEAGADLTVKDTEGKTLLAMSLNYWSEDVTLAMIKKGADVFCEVGYNQTTALIVAIERGMIATAKAILDQISDINAPEFLAGEAFLTAVRRGDEELIWDMIRKGIDIHYTDPNGVNALMQTSGHNLVKVAEYLIDKGIDIYAVSGGLKKNVLFYAAEKCRVEIMKIVLKKDPELIHSRDCFGNTALFETMVLAHHYPSREDQVKCIEFLIEQGVDIFHRNNSNKSVMELVRRYDHLSPIFDREEKKIALLWVEQKKKDRIKAMQDAEEAFKKKVTSLKQDIPASGTQLHVKKQKPLPKTKLQ